jgi:hypothetical protein
MNLKTTLVGAAAVLVLAGCASGEAPSEDPADPTPTTTQTPFDGLVRYLDRIENGPVAEAAELAAPGSPAADYAAFEALRADADEEPEPVATLAPDPANQQIVIDESTLISDPEYSPEGLVEDFMINGSDFAVALGTDSADLFGQRVEVAGVLSGGIGTLVVVRHAATEQASPDPEPFLVTDQGPFTQEGEEQPPGYVVGADSDIPAGQTRVLVFGYPDITGTALGYRIGTAQDAEVARLSLGRG